MADFLDREAVESDDEEELSEKDRRKLKRIRDESDEDDEDEDNEQSIREELADLIDDNPIEDDEEDDDSSDAESERRKGKKRKKGRGSDEEDDRDARGDESDALDDEDLELIEENLGIKVKRQKKLKRVRGIFDESDDEEERGRDDIAQELFDEDDAPGSGGGGGGGASERTDRESRREEPRPGSAAAVENFDEEEESEDEDDVGDFIVDEEGRPVSGARKKRTRVYADQALQDAQDVFGVAFDYDEFDRSDYDDEEYDEDEDLDEYEDEEGGGDAEKPARKARKKRGTKKSIYELYEPTELERGHLTDFDNEIRLCDIPERMQLRAVPVTATKEGTGDPELDEEADWILRHAFVNRTVSSQPLTQDKVGNQWETGSLRSKIRNALDYMRNQSLEVPFIAFYRKEYVEPELKINDLWKVYDYDEKWCQLKKRKAGLLRLFERMRKFKEFPEGPYDTYDTTIPPLAFVLDRGMERLKSADTSEEWSDVNSYFMLYFHLDVAPMKEAEKLQKKEEVRDRRRKAREERKKQREEAGEEGVEAEEVPEEMEEEPEPEDPGNELKRSNKANAYDICRKAGFEALGKMFGLSPFQFGENMRDNYQKHDVEQVHQDPVDVAQTFVDSKFTTAEEVLRAVKYMIATQIAREPLVRQCAREAFFEGCTIDVIPTKKGQKEIDENHPICSMKYLKRKPIRDLLKEQFLRLVTAEEDGLIKLELNTDFKTPTNVLYIDEVKQYFYRDEFSRSVQLWNDQRAKVVELAFSELIFPALKKELRKKLMDESKENVVLEIKKKMYDWVKIAPFTVSFPDKDPGEWGTENGVRVLSICYSSDTDTASFGVIIEADGEVGDFVRLPYVMRRRNAWREADRIGKDQDMHKLREFILSKNPHVIVIGGQNRDALTLKADLQLLVQSLVDEEDYPAIPVEIADDAIPTIFQNSNRAEVDFREYPPLLRQAVSLGRFLQDPLLEISGLCSQDEEVLGVKFHPLQDLLDKETVLEAVYCEMINRTNEVGVDVNVLLNHGWKSNILQFVCGLGPRKAAALLKTLKQGITRLENRTQLVTSCKMGPKVFINCAGFIKIDTASLGDSTDIYVEVLDSTRIHPETYEWARKMAVDALEYNETSGEGQTGIEEHTALEEIMENPENLKELDLDAFADELERQRLGKKKTTLYDIRAELNCRYKDLRLSYRPPNSEELFQMLTKETQDTFYVGKLVLATVVGISHRKPGPDQLDKANPVRDEESGFWQCPFCLRNDFPELAEVWNHFDAGSCPGQATGVRVRLDNGITGFISMKNLSDKPVTNPEERVRHSQVIHCRISRVYVDRFHVDCSSKSSDLLDEAGNFKPAKDPYYDLEAEKVVLDAEEAKKSKRHVQRYTKRVIVHPSFHNITYREAEKLMESMEIGDAIIRPSSRDTNHLTVTWKVTDGIYQHIDVREEGKDNAFSLGSSLWIGAEEFEDLDEIIARHINPMAAHSRDILSYKYYRDTEGGKRDIAERFVFEEKASFPNKIPYILTASKDFPGKFRIFYCPRNKVIDEYVSVTPDGFRYRGQIFDSFNQMLKWFKEHFRDPIAATPRGAITGRTPFTSHTPAAYTVPGLNPEALREAAQNMPSHMFQSLSGIQKAAQTPAYNRTPYSTYTAQTPYTPSGQTPYMTPYIATPGSVSSSASREMISSGSSAKKRSGGSGSGTRASDDSLRPQRGSSQTSSSRWGQVSSSVERASHVPEVGSRTPSTPVGSGTTPRYDERQHERRSAASRRGYDGTPLYDE